MKNKFSERHWTALGQSALQSGWRAATVLTVLMLTATGLRAAPVVETLTDIPYFTYPNYYGLVDGNTLYAEFHTPYGIAVDSTGQFLFVADRDNNAIRELKLALNQTLTFVPNPTTPPNPLDKPVGVAVNGAGDVYVLNRGNGNNGMVLAFDKYGQPTNPPALTSATSLTNATAIALDGIGNIYLTIQSNTLVRIAPSGTRTTIATITNANTALQGIIVKHDGRIAASDSGNNGIWLIDPNNPANGNPTKLTGFNGAGDYTGLNNQGATSANAKFNQPYGVTEAGDGSLVVTDYGNHRVKVVQTSGVVTNLYGVSSSSWVGPLNPSSDVFPGWWDGTVTNIDVYGSVEARSPVGVVFAPDGTVYTTEIYYHVIRKVTSSGLPLPPPPPPPVPAPAIGWVDFPFPEFLSVLHPGSSFVFNNDVILAIKGTGGSQTFFTSGATPATGNILDPSPTSGRTPPPYDDNFQRGSVLDLPATRYPDMTIKAIGTKSDGSPNSLVVQTRIQFVTANPSIMGDNAASFTVSDLTTNAQMWYTIDGTEPTNSAPSLGPISSPWNLSLNISSNTTFKIRAFRDNYQPSQVVFQLFSATSFNANKITFGFDSGEASSDFIASPGQFFYAPVTLSVLPSTKIYSLQFNLTVTNAGPNPGPTTGSGAFVTGFESFLVKPIPNTTPPIFERIPPLSFSGYQADPPPAWAIYYYDGKPFVNMVFTNSAENLLGVGWLERYAKTNLYDTTKQDLIKYSQPHDTQFDELNGRVVAGGYAFQVPTTATAGQTYQIQVGLPSATSDGIGAPGSEVYISTPTNGSLTAGTANSIKIVTVGQRKYIAGDSAPFRWFNAGDFGNTNLNNSDVMQVFQSAIYGFNNPPAGSDFEDAMDSCCTTSASVPGTDYLVPDTTLANDASRNPLFDGNDSMINTIAFGDGVLDVTDIYVTFRRSLDPSLQWFERFWTNGVRAAQAFPNPNLTPAPLPAPTPQTVIPEIKFTAGDGVVAAGQTILVPINVPIKGSHPLRVVGLGITVEPLDGSPAITTPVQFIPNSALGSPTILSSRETANYSAAWLNSSIAGLSGDALLGTLQVTLPANCTSNSAYAVHFDHASVSPNGLASFPRRTRTGLITTSDRSASSFNDGIPDAWRLRYFGTLDNILSQADADADGDGATNLQEYLAGTDPNDAKSVLRVKSQSGQPQECVIRWPSVSGKQYVIERATSLYSPAWTGIATNNGTGWDMEYHDSGTTAGSRFYRVRLAP